MYLFSHLQIYYCGVPFKKSTTNTCCCSVAKSCPTLCKPIDCSTPGFLVLYYLLEFAQTHVNWFDDTIQPSHSLLSLNPPALNLSQHQGLFQWVDSSHQVASASVLPINIEGWFPLGLTCLISCLSKGLSRVFSITTVWKHQFSALSLLYGPTLISVNDYWKNHWFDFVDLCQQINVSAF